MKLKNLIEMINTAQYEDFADEYKKLLGYEKNTEFYIAHADTASLIDYLNTKFNFKLDSSYVAFMKDSNGCKLDDSFIFSFKHEEQDKDVLFVNFDKTTRKNLEVSESAFVAGKYQSAAIVYDKASIIYEDEDEEGYAWGIYSHKYHTYLETFDNFLELLASLIHDRIKFFKED